MSTTIRPAHPSGTDRAPHVLPHHTELARPPLTDRLAIVELIGATTTKAGLKFESSLDTRTYQKDIKVSDAEMDTLNLAGDDFHPKWNYTINPRVNSQIVAIIFRSVLTGAEPPRVRLTATSLPPSQ